MHGYFFCSKENIGKKRKLPRSAGVHYAIYNCKNKWYLIFIYNSVAVKRCAAQEMKSKMAAKKWLWW